MDSFNPFLHSEHLYIEPMKLIFYSHHTTVTKVMRSYMCSHSCRERGTLTEAWQPISTKRPLRPTSTCNLLCPSTHWRLFQSWISPANPLVIGLSTTFWATATISLADPPVFVGNWPFSIGVYKQVRIWIKTFLKPHFEKCHGWEKTDIIKLKRHFHNSTFKSGKMVILQSCTHRSQSHI